MLIGFQKKQTEISLLECRKAIESFKVKICVMHPDFVGLLTRQYINKLINKLNARYS